MFGIAQNVKSKVVECTPERFHQVLDSPQVAQTCADIRDAYEQRLRGEIEPEEFEQIKSRLKRRLPVFTPHATFANGRRVNAEACPSGLSMYDKDHIGNPRGWWDEKREQLREKGLLACVVLAHVTPSAEGVRLFFLIPRGMNLPQAQRWMADCLGDADYDACVKDYARCSFAVPRDYVLHLDEEAMFAPRECPPEVPETPSPVAPTAPATPAADAASFPDTYDGIPYTDIVEVLEEQLGGKPELGGRNNFIFAMACHLRYVCNDNADWIARLLPRYGEEPDRWLSAIRSACNRSQSRELPRIVRRTLAVCKKRAELMDEEHRQTADIALPPPMPKHLPPLIKLLLEKVPDIYKPTVAHAVFPALAAHLWQTTFLYIDNVEHEATLMNVLLAETGSGKSCIDEPINRIMADIRERDAANLAIEREWKEETVSKGANKDKRKRPQGLVIQEVSPNMTNAAFVLRMKEAEGRFLYAKMNELDLFDSLKGSAHDRSHFQIICLAFDPHNTFGQVRVGANAVNEQVRVRFNWNAASTIHKGQRYFRRVLVDGPVSRINFCTIPERPIGAEMPVFGRYDADFDDRLRPYIRCLNEARGPVECRQARQLARKLVEEKAEEARLSQNRVFENLSFRANVIAFLKACVLYVAHGQKWSKAMEEFIRWSLDYDLWCKMRFFGKAIEEEEVVKLTAYARGPQNLLDLLPTVFTRIEAGQVCERQGIRSGSLKQMLANWKYRGYIEPCADDADEQRYTKTEAYLKKYHPDDSSDK